MTDTIETPQPDAVTAEARKPTIEEQLKTLNLEWLRPIGSLGLPDETKRLLELLGINTVGDLIQNTEAKIKTLTSNSRDIPLIRDALTYHGHSFETTIENWPEIYEAYLDQKSQEIDGSIVADTIARGDISPDEKWTIIGDFLMGATFGLEEYTQKRIKVPEYVSTDVCAFAEQYPETVITSEDIEFRGNLRIGNPGIKLIEQCAISAANNDPRLNVLYVSKLSRSSSGDIRNAIIAYLELGLAGELTPMEISMAVAILKAPITNSKGITISEARNAYLTGFTSSDAAKEIREKLEADLSSVKEFMETKDYTSLFNKMMLSRTKDALPAINDATCMDAFAKVANVLTGKIPFVQCRMETYFRSDAPESRFIITYKP